MRLAVRFPGAFRQHDFRPCSQTLAPPCARRPEPDCRGRVRLSLVALAAGLLLVVAWIAQGGARESVGALFFVDSGYRGPGVQSNRAAPDGVSEGTTTAEASHMDLDRLPDRTPAGSTATVIVVDEVDQSPISGALIVRDHAARRSTPRDRIEELGRSDPSGRLTFDLDGSETLCVLAEAYAPQRTTVVAGGIHQVAMVRGFPLTVSCRVGGRPLADCIVLLSKAELPPVSWRAPSLLGASLPGAGHAGIYSGSSDPTGMLRLAGLPAGTYFIDAYSHGHVPVGKTPSGKLHIPGTTHLELEFERMFAVAPAVIGDEILASSLVARGGASGSTATMRYLDAERARLLEAFPQALDAVVVLESELQAPWFSEVGSLLATPLVSVNVLAKHAGFQRFELQPVPVVELLEPALLDLDPLPGAGASTATIEVSLVDAKGVDVSHALGGRFVLVIQDNLRMRLHSGTNTAPAGTYEIVALDERWRGSFAPTSVNVPGAVRIELGSEVQLVRLRVLDEAGIQYERYRFSLESAGRRTEHFAFDATELAVPLPIGPAVVELHVRGFAAKRHSFLVEARAESQEVEILLDAP